MKPTVSIAIETTCRTGGAALGIGDALRDAVAFDASVRHATQLISRLDELLRRAGRGPSDVDELYVSAGPGSFTGTRVAVTVARTMGQALPELKCVAVPTMAATAENARDLPWENLGVILDARQNCICAGLFARADGEIASRRDPEVSTPAAFLAAAPRPLLLIGEGLAHHDLAGEGIEIGPAELHLPTAEGVWRVGRRMARDGQFTDYLRILPTYVRKPEATRLWDRRHGGAEGSTPPSAQPKGRP